jgi:aryl-alcohol dehydrogenase-like predicted oxidoreductase
MHYRPLGQSGIQASVVGLGTWAIGGWMWGGTDEAKAIRAIQASLDAGVSLIDTAPAYGMGLSETIVGKAIAGRRDKVVLATKLGLVWHVQKGQHFFDEHGKPVHRYLGPQSIRYEIEQSLKRLNTDYIDLYQTHWQDATTPIEKTMKTLLDLKQEGKIRAIGVSNCTIEQLGAYRKVGPLDSTQEKYSLLDRELEKDYLPYTRRNNIAMLAYSPLANGLLTGKIGPERQFPPDDLRYNNPRFSVESRREVQAFLDRVRPIATDYQVTLAQIVIAWTLAQPGVTRSKTPGRGGSHCWYRTSTKSTRRGAKPSRPGMTCGRRRRSECNQPTPEARREVASGSVRCCCRDYPSPTTSVTRPDQVGKPPHQRIDTLPGVANLMRFSGISYVWWSMTHPGPE